MVNEELEKYREMQKEDMIRAFQEYYMYPVGVDKFETLKTKARTFPCIIDFEWDEHVIKKETSFIRTIKIEEKTYKEYWVDVNIKNYRSNFLAFLEREYGVKDVPKNLHVDHVLAKAYAIEVGIRYVRVALIKDTINREAGTYNEKGLKYYATKGLGHKDVVLMNYPIAMKVFEIAPFKSQADLNERVDCVSEEMSKHITDSKDTIKKCLKRYFHIDWWPVLAGQQHIRNQEFEKYKKEKL